MLEQDLRGALGVSVAAKPRGDSVVRCALGNSVAALPLGNSVLR